jgi:hypothetical protein
VPTSRLRQNSDLSLALDRAGGLLSALADNNHAMLIDAKRRADAGGGIAGAVLEPALVDNARIIERLKGEIETAAEEAAS